MTADYYTKELEKVIANWHDCGENENPTPIFNIIKLGMEHDMQVLVPIETPNTFLKYMGNIDEIKITAMRDCKVTLVTEEEYPLHLKKDQTVFLDKNFKERGRKTK